MPTRPTRNAPASARNAAAWLTEDPESVATKFRSGELDALDAVRHFAVILDWDTGAVLPKSTAQFREMFAKRASAYWAD